MSINFDVNTQVNELVVSTDHLPDDAVVDFKPILRAVLQVLDPPFSLDQIRNKEIPMEYTIFTGPAVTFLADTQFRSYAYRSIIYVGQTENEKQRIREWEKLRDRHGHPVFDIVRAVFIEQDGIRRFVEKQMIKLLSRPDSGHADCLINLRGRRRFDRTFSS
jgi:hypothetical protein